MDDSWYLQKVLLDECHDSQMLKLATLWRENKMINSKNIYAKNIKNEKIMNLKLEGFMKYL